MSASFITFVIDADVARSSGETEHPVSSGSRKLLESVSNGGHMLAMCSTLNSEWRKHQSRFATRWLASMVAKRKIVRLKPAQNIHDHINEHLLESKAKQIALKDAHLVDAALEADKIIASNDNTARKVFCEIASTKKELKKIIWFNAIDDKEAFEQKIITGNIAPKNLFLGNGS